MLRFAASRPTQATAVDDMAVELAVLRDGHVGRASTNDLSDEALAACGRRAANAAEAAARSVGSGPYPGFPAPTAGAVPLRARPRDRAPRRGHRGRTAGGRLRGGGPRRGRGPRHLDRRRGRDGRGLERGRRGLRARDRRLHEGHLHRPLRPQRVRRAHGGRDGRARRRRPGRARRRQGDGGGRPRAPGAGRVPGGHGAGGARAAARHARHHGLQRAGSRRGARRAPGPAGRAGGRARRSTSRTPRASRAPCRGPSTPRACRRRHCR